MAWFKKARKPIATPEKTSRVPEGLWVKCPECDTIIYTKDLVKNLHVCGKCAHHFRLNATDRLKTLFDDEVWEEIAPNLASNDPLKFTDTKPYKSRLAATQKLTGKKDAVIVAVGRINGVEAIVASMDYSFIGGSMGVVVGEKIVRGIELALERRAPMLDRVVLGRRPHDGRRVVADADGQDLGRAGAARSRAPALHLDPHRSHHRRRHRELRDARRPQHRRAEGAHRLCRPARDRADHPPEAARRLSAERVPGRARHARSRGRSPRDEGHAGPRAAVHGPATDWTRDSQD